MFGPDFRDFVSEDAALQDQLSSKRLIKSWHGSEKQDSGDSGHGSDAEEEQNTNRATRSKFQLTQSLLSKVKANENSANANSGKQAYIDLPRMNFIINGKTISKDFVDQLCDRYNQELQSNKRQVAKHVLIEMFKHAEAEVPDDSILEELVTNCNQAGYDGSLLLQLFPIFLKYNLQLPDANDRQIGIVCSNQGFLNIKYCPSMPVKQQDTNIEICRLDAILEFTLKSQDGKVEYKDGKVTLTIPEQLKDCKSDGKSLLGDINRHFEDADNAVVESLVANIGEGPKSFVADPPAEVDSDVDNSFDIIPKNFTFDRILNILNKAKNGDYTDLDEVMGDIKKEKDYIPINPDLKHLKAFCSQQLNLTAQTDHERVREVLIEKMYKEENGTVKGLVLLAIAASDMFTKRYAEKHKDVLFQQSDEDLDRLLIGAGKGCYIEFLLEHLEKELDSILSWRGIYEKLKRASSIGNQECVKAVLNRFEDTESRDPAISSKLLHYAVEKGDYDLVDSFIKNGADVNIQDRDDKTALHYAASSNKDEIVRLLFKEGANEEIKDKSGKTFLDMVASGTKSFLLNVLRPEGLLHHAAMEGNIDRVKRLLAKGENVNAENNYGKSPLSVAIEAGNLEVIKLLVSKNAVITKKAIQYARNVYKNCEEGKKQAHLDVLTFLVDIHIRAAITQGNLERIKSYVNKGAVITEEIIQCARDVYKNCEEGKKQAHLDVLTFLVDIHIRAAITQGNLERIKSYVNKGTVITEETIQYAKDVCKNYKERRVYIAKYPGGMEADRQNRKEILDFPEGKNSNLVNETATSSQVVNEEDNYQSENPGLESAGSKQPQENVDKGNIIDNEKASIEEAIDNDYRGGKMSRGKKSTKQKMSKNKEGIKPELSNAIYSPKTMESYLKRNNIDEPILKSIIDKVNAKIQKKKEEGKNIINPDPTKKQRCIDQRNTLLKTRDLLEEKIKSIGTDAKAAVSSVTDVSATTSSHEAPVNIDDEKKQAHVQPAEHVPEESAELKAQPSNTQEQQEVSETPVPEQTDDIESLSTQDALVLQSKSATVLSVDSDEKKQASLNDEVFYDAKESMLGTTNSKDGSTLEGDSDKQESQPKSVPTPLVARDDECSSISSDASDASTIKAAGDFEDKQPNSSPLLPQSSVSGDEHSGSSPSFINVPTSDEGDTDNSEVSSEDITKEDSSGRLAGEGNQQNSQPPLPSFDLSSLQMWFVDDAVFSIAGDSHSEASSTVSKDFLIEDVTDEKEPLLDKTNKGDSMLKSSNSPQSTKSSKLPTVAIWTLAVAGILAGVAVPVAYFAFGASLLVAGITAGVGAWCLVAAAIIYCFNRPASSVENSNVETVKTDELTAS